MKISTTVFATAKFQKAHLMDIVTRLSEGHHMRYVMGNGAKPATLRRVLIYEKETGIAQGPRPKRKTDPIESVNKEKKKNRKYVEHKPPSKTKLVKAAIAAQEAGKGIPVFNPFIPGSETKVGSSDGIVNPFVPSNNASYNGVVGRTSSNSSDFDFEFLRSHSMTESDCIFENFVNPPALKRMSTWERSMDTLCTFDSIARLSSIAYSLPDTYKDSELAYRPVTRGISRSNSYTQSLRIPVPYGVSRSNSQNSTKSDISNLWTSSNDLKRSRSSDSEYSSEANELINIGLLRGNSIGWCELPDSSEPAFDPSKVFLEPKK